MLSAALIVKNEKDHIRDVLTSLVGVDEIVVYDTGSTDNTVELAKEFTDKVYTDYTWNDHFAEARNHALSKCTGDWVLSIDADEVLEDGGVDKIRALIEKATPDQKTFSVKMVHGGHIHYLPRLFRREGTKWVGRAHETLAPIQDNRTDITIEYGYSTAHKGDPDRMFRILKRAVEENPNSSRDLYYLGREYWYRKDWANAIFYFDKAAQLSRWIPEKADALLYSARCNFNLAQGDAAREKCLRAIQTNPDFKEALAFMAELHYEPWHSKWQKIADQATNKDVLFLREIKKLVPKKPLDMSDMDILAFKNILAGYKHVDVLEWGAGNSTQYFPKFLRDIGVSYTWEAVEHDKGWFNVVKGWRVPDVTVHYAERDTDDYYNRQGKYDVIFIDGRNRRKCLLKAKELLKEDGVVLIHDADRVYYQCAFEGYHGKFLNPKGTQPRLWAGKLQPFTGKIPKIIHQIWIGKKQPPLDWMNTWKDKNPDFQYILWDDQKINDIGLKNKAIYDKYYADECFNGCANIARAEILEAMGGVYIDADSICEHPLSDGPFMDWDIFSVYEADNFFVEGKRLVANGIIGCVPDHPIIAEYVKKQSEITDIHPSWYKSGPMLWTTVMKKGYACLPPYTFLPIHHSGVVNKVDGVVYSKQFWGTSKKIYL